MARVVAAIVAACAAAAIAAPAAGPSQTATVGEYVYATIDNAWPQAEPDGSKDCSAQFNVAVPDGWAIAPDNKDTMLAIAVTPFGTDHLVVSSGRVYDHELATVMDGALLQMSSALFNATSTPATAAKPVTTGNVKIVNKACPARVLIVRDTKADKHTEPYQVAPTITNFITFNQTDYAMIDNTNASAPIMGTCMRDKYTMPEGWDVAGNNLATQVIAITARYPFGYKCQVNADGVAYERHLNASDTDCSKPEKYLQVQELKPLNLTLYSVAGGNCGGILISRPSTNNDTWLSEISNEQYENYYEAPDGTNYATLDDTPYSVANTLTGDAACQNVPMKLPSWFKAVPVVKNSTNFPDSVDPNLLAAGEKPWGTYCKSGMDTMGQPCQQTILQAGDYYSSEFCSSRILIRYVGEKGGSSSSGKGR